MVRASFLTWLVLLTTAGTLAQAPQRMGFQAVVRDGSGALVTDAPVGMRISVLQGSETGTPVYVETHAPQTNANGLATLEIGGGAVVSGSFAAIDWANGPWFLRTETDPDGGTDYSITGASQLLSVPYALHAANSQPGPQGPQGPPGTSDCPVIRTADGRAVVYTATTAHGFGLASTGGSQWFATNIDGPVVGSIANDTAVVLFTTTTAYGFHPSSTGGSMWSSTALNGTPVGAVASSGRIVVFTGSQAYGLGRASTTGMQWSTTNLDGPVVDHVAAGNRIVLFTNSTAYGYGRASTGGSIWAPTTLPGPPQGGQGTR
jgi:hypothetical protein